jgi:S-formylglutathione hydrolase FrmB
MLEGILIAGLAVASLPEGCRQASERLLECERSFVSLHGGRAQFTVHLPEGHGAGVGRRWPVVLMLHGAGRNHRTLPDQPAALAALRKSRAVIVMPDGGSSWWLGGYGEYPLELLDWLTPHLNLAGDAGGRAVAGWSMGGFGSLRMIGRRPGSFSAWGGILALADFPNPAYPPEQNHSVPSVFGPPEKWAEQNPMRNARHLRGKRMWFATADGAFDRSMNRALHSRLTAENIPHEYMELDGSHKFETVAVALPRLLEWLDRHFEEASR